jgi:branched-chain amino acid transport system ATP-binding protein
MILELNQLNVFIKTSHILHDVSLSVGEREVVCLIGRNGAGKTTTLKTIMGFLRPESGSVTFMDREITGLPTHQIANLGIGFAPEESGIFPDLTVEENIEIATWQRQSSHSPEERTALAYEVFPALTKYRNRKGTQMSGGERKMLSVARALAMDPHLFLLDECFEGLSPIIVPKIAESIHEIVKMGHSIILAESNIYHVPDFTDTLYVIERGEIIFSGKPIELKDDKAVLKIVSGAV